jgi:hypothetical protein
MRKSGTDSSLPVLVQLPVVWGLHRDRSLDGLLSQDFQLQFPVSIAHSTPVAQSTESLAQCELTDGHCDAQNVFMIPCTGNKVPQTLVQSP